MLALCQGCGLSLYQELHGVDLDLFMIDKEVQMRFWAAVCLSTPGSGAARLGLEMDGCVVIPQCGRTPFFLRD